MQGYRSEQGKAVFDERLAAQAPLRQVIEEQIAVEFDLLVAGVASTEDLQQALYLAVLERAGNVSEEMAADPRAAWLQRVPKGQQANVQIVIESVGGRLCTLYDDYLRRHWLQRSSGLEEPAGSIEWIQQALSEHLSALRSLLEAGGDGAWLAAQIEVLQRDWAAQVG